MERLDFGASSLGLQATISMRIPEKEAPCFLFSQVVSEEHNFYYSHFFCDLVFLIIISNEHGDLLSSSTEVFPLIWIFSYPNHLKVVQRLTSPARPFFLSSMRISISNTIHNTHTSHKQPTQHHCDD